MARRIVTVQWVRNRGLGFWRATNVRHLHFTRKDRAVKAAAAECRRALERGELSELRIKGKSGRIQDARTYGADPRRSKG